MATATTAELLELKPVRRVLFVLGRHVVAFLTIRALQNNVISSAFRHFLPLYVWSPAFRRPPEGGTPNQLLNYF